MTATDTQLFPMQILRLLRGGRLVFMLPSQAARVHYVVGAGAREL